MTTLLLVPSPIEWRNLTHDAPLGDTLPTTSPFSTAKANGQVWALCGIGPAAAALTAASLIPRVQPTRVLLLGIAGAFTQSHLEPGDIVQVNEDRFADLGHNSGGQWHNLDAMNLPMLPLAKGTLGCRYKLPILDQAEPAASAITVSTVTSSQERAEDLWRDYQAGLENMEGAAVAMACAFHQIPFYQIRAVSNKVGPRAPASWLVTEPLKRLRDWTLQRIGPDQS